MASNQPYARPAAAASAKGTQIEAGRLPVSTGRPPAVPSAAQWHKRVTGTRYQQKTASSPIGAKPLFPRAGRAELATALPPFDESRAVDAGLLSHGGLLAARLARLEAAVRPEALIGRDNRTQVDDATNYPHRCVCYLRIWLDVGWFAFGTGWIIGKRTIITAGHCVYAYPDSRFPGLVRGWARQVEVIPGRNGDAMPFGSFIVPTENLRSTQGWAGTDSTGDDGKQEGADYGAIILDEDLPTDLGAFGFGVLSNRELEGLNVNIIGYPGEYQMPPLLGTMWGDSGLLDAPTGLQLDYTIDTTEGESGAAVFYMRPTVGDAIAVGIHNYGTENVINNATRITEEVKGNLKTWRDEGGV